VYGAGWCKSTKNFLLYQAEAVANEVKKLPHTAIGWVDLYENFDLADKLKIRHFPTITLYTNWGKES
jgi:hypothetical protein